MRRSNLPFRWSFLLTYVKLFCPHKMWQSWLIPRHMVGVEICPFLKRKYVFIFQKQKGTVSHSTSSCPSHCRWEDNMVIFWADDWPWFITLRQKQFTAKILVSLTSVPSNERILYHGVLSILNSMKRHRNIRSNVRTFFGYILLLRRCQSVFLQPLNVTVASFSQSVFQRSVYFTLMNKSSPVLVLS